MKKISLTLFLCLLPLVGYAAAPVIEAGDITTSENNTADETPDVAYPAYENGDLLVMFLMSDNQIEETVILPATGPNGETRTIIGNGNSGGGTGSANISAIWWQGTASRIAGTLEWTIVFPGENWIGRCIKVLAAETDGTTPVDSVSLVAGNSINSTLSPTPAWTGIEAGGRVVTAVAIDTDAPVSAATDWVQLTGEDIGSVGAAVYTRDAATSAAEDIPSVNHIIESDVSSTLGLVINGPLTSDTLLRRRR